jgi:hypothetical protein
MGVPVSLRYVFQNQNGRTKLFSRVMPASVFSARVPALNEEVLKAMLLTKLKATAALLLLALSASTCVVLATGQGNRQDDEKKTSQDSKMNSSRMQDKQALWKELASTDDVRATRAILAFAAKPRESTAFFKERLKPVHVDSDRIKKLVAQLDDNEFIRRQAAAKELAEEVEYLGEFARPILEQCLKEKGEMLEVKMRINRVLEQLITSDPKELIEQAELDMAEAKILSKF